MTTHPALTKAGEQYAKAYSTHHRTKDLPEALELYRGVMAAHPKTPEAGYSRSQVTNFVNSVVPEQMLRDAHLALALDQFALRAEPKAKSTG